MVLDCDYEPNKGNWKIQSFLIPPISSSRTQQRELKGIELKNLEHKGDYWEPNKGNWKIDAIFNSEKPISKRTQQRELKVLPYKPP